MTTPRRRRPVRIATISLLALIVLAVVSFAGAYAVWGWRHVPSFDASATLPAADFLSWEQHNTIYQAHDGPYVLTLGDADSSWRGVYIGTFHTSDPDDVQIDLIQSTWDSMAPTVALCEGRMGLYIGGLRTGVGMFGESGAVYALARRDHVPIYSLEPEYADEVAALLAEYPPEHLAIFFTMRVFWSECRGTSPNTLDALALHLLRKRTNIDGLRETIVTIDELDRVWRRDFPDLPDWRSAASNAAPAYQIYENNETVGGRILDAIANSDREFRGQHMIRSIIDLLQRGERVFAVVGRSHVIRQEPILRAALGDAGVTLLPPGQRPQLR